MNAHPNAVTDSRFESHAVAAQTTRPTRPFYWSLRRELWENRSITIGPVVAAGFAVLAALLAQANGKGIFITHDGNTEPLSVAQQLNFVGLLIMGVTFVVAIFYCLDAFYGERQDRSILFWKSLPISDTTATLAKASVPIIIIPLVTFVVAAITQWIVLAIDAATLAAHGGSIGHIPLLQMQAGLLYHLIAVHGLWYAPIFAWLLLISAFAPKAPILWAILPPTFIEILESIVFHTSYFSRFLAYRFGGGISGPGLDAMGMPHRTLSGTAAQFFTSPDLWIGLVIAALFLAAAIQLRRYRSPN